MMSASTTIENHLKQIQEEEIQFDFKKRINGTVKRRKRKDKIQKLYYFFEHFAD
jgi:hypothetical protein